MSWQGEAGGCSLQMSQPGIQLPREQAPTEVSRLKLVRVYDLAKICFPEDSERGSLDTKNAFSMMPGKSKHSKPQYCKIFNQANIIAIL